MAKPQYGRGHQAEREKWRPEVDAGRALCHEPICLEPSRQIEPGTPWDLSHDRASGAWTGPSHARCNRTEGAKHGRAQQLATASNIPYSEDWT